MCGRVNVSDNEGVRLLLESMGMDTWPTRDPRHNIAPRVQNSRADKVWSSRLWKPLIEHQRVLVPVNGFYEWKRVNKKIQATFYITPANGSAMFFAGIYKLAKEELHKPEVSLITTTANEAMGEVHHRMPVILNSQNAAMAWLQEQDKVSLTQLMTPASNETLQFTEVSNFVNKSSNEGPECIEPKVA